jgi:hypothetical protein
MFYVVFVHCFEYYEDECFLVSDSIFCLFTVEGRRQYSIEPLFWFGLNRANMSNRGILCGKWNASRGSYREIVDSTKTLIQCCQHVKCDVNSSVLTWCGGFVGLYR